MEKRQSVKQPNLLAYYSRQSTSTISQPNVEISTSASKPAADPIAQTPIKKKFKQDDEDEDLVPERLKRKQRQNELESEDAFVQEEQEAQSEEEEQDRVNKKRNTGKKNGSKKTNKGKSAKKQEDQEEGEGEERQNDQAGQAGEPIEWTDRTPSWALPPLCRDKKQRLCSDPMYDCTTLWIPTKQFSNLTSSMKQYWTFKSDHFDKILFFKVGKFYQLFYEDAYVGNKHLNLKWMGTKMHTGFPEKSLELHLRRLVQLGFKVVVIDQTETPKQMLERLKEEKAKSGRKSEKIVLREITAVHTKGTSAVGQAEDNYMPNYLISFFKHSNIHAFSLFDHMTNSIHVGVCKSLEEFKSVIYSTRPTQLLFDPTNLPYQYKKMMTDSFLGMIQSPLQNKNNQWHYLNAEKRLEQVKGGEKYLKDLAEEFESDKQFALKTLSGLFAYLKQLFLLDNALEVCRFKMYDQDFFGLQSLILDSQAVQHLELFETNYLEKPTEGSLFNTIDRCSSFFGKRMLRQWLLKPSRSQKIINDRLDAVEDFNNMFNQTKKMTEMLRSVGDLEKLVHKTYHFSSKNNQTSKAIFYDDFNVKKLKEIKDLTEKLSRAYILVVGLQRRFHEYKSNRLKRLISSVKDQASLADEKVYQESDEDLGTERIQGLLPNVQHHLDELNSFLLWKDNIPIPQRGLVPEYDQVEIAIDRKKDQLESYLQSMRTQTRQPNLNFTHVKQRYEIQAPQRLKKRQDFIFSSRKNGYNRYVTSQSRNLVSELEELEENKKSQLKLFVNFFCHQFSRKKNIWERFVRVLAEIDCLISLSLVSYQWVGVRPVFNNPNGMKIIGGKHPCLNSSQFIPNDIILTPKTNIMMLTGPNMGGKSTLLRTSCLLVILAQMGMRVPCQSYDCHIFDRVFTRIGASDKLEEGKSTFFIEMEQALTIVKSATQKSFIIMDELGRGTSTFDGMSIAFGVIKDLAQKIKCLGIVSTHYHILIEQFLSHPNITLNTMDYRVDEKSKRIVFLYRTKPGYCTQSFAFNVVRAVGLKPEILTRAQQKAQKIYAEIQEKRNQQTINRKFEKLMRSGSRDRGNEVGRYN